MSKSFRRRADRLELTLRGCEQKPLRLENNFAGARPAYVITEQGGTDALY